MLPPNINHTTLQSLIERMKQISPYYTPEWRFTPEQPDPGSALFMIVAEMLLENTKRFNQVPLNHYIAYLNLFDVSLLSAKPARAYVTFTMNAGSPYPVLIPMKTEVTAPGEEEEIIFETEQPLLVTPAIPTHVFTTNGQLDQIVYITNQLHELCVMGTLQSFEAFPNQTTANMQQHCMYIAQDDVLHLIHPSTIELELYHEKKFASLNQICTSMVTPNVVTWEYWNNDQWHRFEQATSMDNKITLFKNSQFELSPVEVNGITARWIRASVGEDLLDELKYEGELPEIDNIQLRSTYIGEPQSGIHPDTLFNDDVEVKPSGFYPFGEFFAPQSCFYLSCREALSKKGGLITLQFNLRTVPNQMSQPKAQVIDYKLIMKKNAFDEPEIPLVSVMKAVWEYWNGMGWVRLFNGEEYESLFYKPEEDQWTVVFHCPDDMIETTVNSHQNYWIRCKIMKTENLYTADPIYLSPWIEDVRFRFEYGDVLIQAEQCQTLNSLQWSNRRGNIASTQKLAFRPYEVLDCERPALYIGFDQPPEKGPISIYISIEAMGIPPESSFIRLEYLRKKPGVVEWVELKVDDDTFALRRSGTIQFVGPPDFVSQQRYGVSAYWIRAIWMDHSRDASSPVINGIYMNTVSAIQQESFTNENPVKLKSGLLEFRLSKTPVRSEEVWVDETGQLLEEQIVTMNKINPESIEIIRDSEGNIQRVWTRWKRVESWSDSTSDDRHYLINRNAGIISFGNGTIGRLPHPFDSEKIKVHYKQTKGAEGNVPARAIASSRDSFAFINTVFNPEPSAGGSQSETLEEALERGPHMIKHRGRAVTAEDFEWLAREASLQVAKAKCLPNMNARLEQENGTVTVVVLPKGGHTDSSLFLEVKRQVLQYLLERAPNTVAQTGRVHVIAPAYLELSVNVELVVTSMDAVLSTEQAVIQKLQQFLDPLTGNYDHRGWEIGQPIHISSFYPLLKSIPTINHITKITMDIIKLENGLRLEIPISEMSLVIHGIITSGVHHIRIRAN
jgi:hypothetical protein